MFGLMKGNCGLAPCERAAWMGHLCGLCGAARQAGGHSARLATNPDAALLSALCAAQRRAPVETETTRCFLRKRRTMEVVTSSSDGARLAASVSLLMGATAIRDDLADGEGRLGRAPWLGHALADRWSKLGADLGNTVGFDVSTVVSRSDEQPHIERQRPRDFSTYARPTELAVASAFGHTAVLAGRPQNAPHLHDIGRMYGRLMVLLDSYEDRLDDAARGRLNFLIETVAPAYIEPFALRTADNCFRTMKMRFDRLDLPRRELLDTLFGRVLYRRARRILGPSLALASPSGSDRPPKEDYWSRPNDEGNDTGPQRGRRDVWSDQDYWGRPDDLPPESRRSGHRTPADDDRRRRDDGRSHCDGDCGGGGGGSGGRGSDDRSGDGSCDGDGDGDGDCCDGGGGCCDCCKIDCGCFGEADCCDCLECCDFD